MGLAASYFLNNQQAKVSKNEINSMNSADERQTESSALLPANKNFKQKFERLAQAMWAIVLVAPFPIVLTPIVTDLARIESLQIYVFNILIWCSAFSAYFVIVFSRWNKFSYFPTAWTSRLLLGAGLVCYAGSIFAQSIEVATLGWVLQAAAWLGTHSGAKDNNAWKLLIHLPALCVLLRIPEFVAGRMELAYQHLLSSTTASLFEFSGIPFRRDDANFEFARSAFTTDGLLANSSYIGWMLFVCCLIVAWLRRPTVLLPAYLGVALFWVFGMHLLQMLILGFTHQAGALDLSSGWQASLLSASTLVAAVALLLSSDRCLRILFMPVPQEASSRGPMNPIIGTWNKFLLPLAANYNDET